LAVATYVTIAVIDMHDPEIDSHGKIRHSISMCLCVFSQQIHPERKRHVP